MFGAWALVFQIAFVISPLVILIVIAFSFRRHKLGWLNWLRLVILTPIAMLWLFVSGTQLYNEFAGFVFLSTLHSDDVASISVGDVSWQDQENIRLIVKALNQPIWHLTNHDGGGPFQPLKITMRSGEIKSFRVGRYYQDAGVIIQFYRPFGSGTWEDGGSYVPGLAVGLQRLGYVLPANLD